MWHNQNVLDIVSKIEMRRLFYDGNHYKFCHNDRTVFTAVLR